MLRCFDFPFRLDADEPFASRLRDGDVARLPEDVLRLAVAHPAEFRQFDTSVLVVYLKTLRDAKTFTLALLFELRKVASLLKEVRVRPFQIFECLLQRLRWYLRQKFVLHLPVGQPGTQFGVAETLLSVLVAFDGESKCFVVDETAGPGKLAQAARLFAVRHQCEFEGLPSQPNRIELLVDSTVK